jgi:hypothetical protein
LARGPPKRPKPSNEVLGASQQLSENANHVCYGVHIVI